MGLVTQRYWQSDCRVSMRRCRLPAWAPAGELDDWGWRVKDGVWGVSCALLIHTSPFLNTHAPTLACEGRGVGRFLGLNMWGQAGRQACVRLSLLGAHLGVEGGGYRTVASGVAVRLHKGLPYGCTRGHRTVAQGVTVRLHRGYRTGSLRGCRTVALGVVVW